MSKSAAVAATLLGIVLLLGSCVPLGLTIHSAGWDTPVYTASLQFGEPLRSEVIRAAPGRLVRIAVEARIETPSVQEEKVGQRVSYKARYRFPVVFTILDAEGNRLAERREALAWDSQVMTHTENERTDSVGGSMTVKHSFDAIEAPPSGVIVVEARMEPDQQYLARASGVQLFVYDNQGSVRNRMALFALMFIGGGLLTVVGLIFSASSMAAAAPLAGSPSPGGPSTVPASSRRLAATCHALGLVGYLIPLGNVLAPLALWLYWRNSDPYVDRHGKEAINFQLSVVVYLMASLILVLLIIGLFLLFAVALLHFVFMVAGAASAASGKDFRYPMIIRFVK